MSDRIENPEAGALAETYARPLLNLAEQADAVDSVQQQLDEIVELLEEHPSLKELFFHQAIDVERRAETIERLFKDRADDLIVRFLLVLNDHQRLSQIGPIRQAYDQLVKASRNQVDVTLYTAQPLDAEQQQAVAERLSQSLGREAVVHPRTDERLIGGLRIRYEDQLIDASVASQLRRMSQQIQTHGHDAVRSAAERLLSDVDNGQLTPEHS